MVIPNTKEAEYCLELMCTHMGVYLWNSLKMDEAEEEFISNILFEALEPSLVHEAPCYMMD